MERISIKRINGYDDTRFSKNVLFQHGGYLVNGYPCEIEIIGQETAIVRGGELKYYPDLIEAFLFYAPHISCFIDEEGTIISERNKPEIFTLNISDIQPSQFFVDEEKLSAVKTFIKAENDIIIQVIPCKEKYISLDGHTRLYLAVQEGYQTVRAVVSTADADIWSFVTEAKRLGVYTPKDLKPLTHAEYEIKWNRYCDNVLGSESE